LHRNVAPHDGGIYDSDLAHARARERASRRRVARVAADSELREVLQSKLELEWSPEQISAWLRLTYPEQPRWHLCHETIYQAVYNPARGGLSRHFTKKLRTGRPLRRRRRRARERAVRFVAPAKLITCRPAIVSSRVRLGDWEGDLIMGRGNRSAIGTLVDRRSGYVVLVHLPAGHNSEAVRDALITVLIAMPAPLRKSLTWDQGSEMACHDEIAHLFSDGVYFAEPGRPWQRGSNENTNGLLRQYFAKGTDLSAHTAEHLANVAQRLNTRPRKRLGWRTPAEVLAAHLRC
jgi:IS30 family transposase